MANAKAIVSTAASLAASAMLIRSIAVYLLPFQLDSIIFTFAKRLSQVFSSQLTIVVEEFQGFSINQVFEAAEIYLGSISNPSVQTFQVSKDEDCKLAVSIDRNEEVSDIFENIHFKWKLITTQVETTTNRHQNIGELNSSLRSEVRSKVFKSYFPYILEKSKTIREERKIVKIKTFDHEIHWVWDELDLNHPMTLDNLA